MTGPKVEALKEVLFKNKSENMAKVLHTSQAKISLACNGKQGLALESIIVLLTDYKVDPNWFFRGEDNDPPVFVGDESKLKTKYYETVEKLSVLQEELVGYQKQEISELKQQTGNNE